MFSDLIRKLYDKTGCGVVLLIDEYDKPIIGHIEDGGEAESFRAALESFYQTIKGAEAMLRFVFLTGVTKFAKVSIFSKLNNLSDISMNKRYATMFGYTQAELEQNFTEHMEAVVQAGTIDNWNRIMDKELLLENLRIWYDGFCFAEGCDTVYNPVSIGKFFYNDGEFANYWFETGTPTFLLKLLLSRQMMLTDMVEARMSLNSLATFNLAELAGTAVEPDRVVQLLFQTGYLTLGDMFMLGGVRHYKLRFPNFEVRSSFEVGLLKAYDKHSQPDSYAVDLYMSALKGDTQQGAKDT